jgi:hypothetical protein
MGAPYPAYVDENGSPTAVKVQRDINGAPVVPFVVASGINFPGFLNSQNAFQANLGTKIAGEDLTNDVMKTREALQYTNLTASQLIKTGAGVVAGVIVNSNTAGTFKLWDNTSAATTVIVNTYTVTTAVSSVVVFPKPISFNTGLYCTVGGTADFTIVWA